LDEIRGFLWEMEGKSERAVIQTARELGKDPTTIITRRNKRHAKRKLARCPIGRISPYCLFTCRE